MPAKKMQIRWVEDPDVDLTQYEEAFTKPEHIAKLVRDVTKELYSEQFVFVALDCNKKLIGYSILSEGSHIETLVSTGNLVRIAALSGALFSFIGHNHPGGISKPSVPDRLSTIRMITALRLIEVRVLDHIIVGNDGTFTSLRKTDGYLWDEAKKAELMQVYKERVAVAAHLRRM